MRDKRTHEQTDTHTHTTAQYYVFEYPRGYKLTHRMGQDVKAKTKERQNPNQIYGEVRVSSHSQSICITECEREGESEIKNVVRMREKGQ